MILIISPTGRWYIHTCKYHLVNKEYEFLVYGTVDDYQNNDAEQKKPDPKDYILYDSIYVKFQKV